MLKILLQLVFPIYIYLLIVCQTNSVLWLLWNPRSVYLWPKIHAKLHGKPALDVFRYNHKSNTPLATFIAFYTSRKSPQIATFYSDLWLLQNLPSARLWLKTHAKPLQNAQSRSYNVTINPIIFLMIFITFHAPKQSPQFSTFSSNKRLLQNLRFCGCALQNPPKTAC